MDFIVFLFYRVLVWLYALVYPRFGMTADVSNGDFYGGYVQVARTPNSFQNTPYATAEYSKTGTLRNTEWDVVGQKLVAVSRVGGTYTDDDTIGTKRVRIDGAPVSGMYRILHFEKVARLGTFMCVTSATPNTAWILWKPDDLDAAEEAHAHAHALEHVLDAAGTDTRTLIFADKEVAVALAHHLSITPQFII